MEEGGGDGGGDPPAPQSEQQHEHRLYVHHFIITLTFTQVRSEVRHFGCFPGCILAK